MPEQRGLFEPRSWPLFPHFQRASLYMPCISILAPDVASCGERSGYPTFPLDRHVTVTCDRAGEGG